MGHALTREPSLPIFCLSPDPRCWEVAEDAGSSAGGVGEGPLLYQLYQHVELNMIAKKFPPTLASSINHYSFLNLSLKTAKLYHNQDRVSLTLIRPN